MLLQEMLDRAVRLFGGHPALVDGDVRMTYRQLDERVRKLSAALQGLGLAHGDHVAILSANSFRYMEAYLMGSVAGLVIAPINNRLNPRETAFILDDAEVKALLIGREFLPLLEEIRKDLPLLRHVIVMDGDGSEGAGWEGNGGKGGSLKSDGLHGYEALVAAADPASLRLRDWNEDDMAFLCYTGGTTGLPKGVMLSQRNMVANSLHAIQAAEFNERDVWLHVCPMFHAADNWSCYAVTALGGFHVFQERFEPRHTLDLIQEHRVSILLLVPTMINMILELPDAGEFDLSSIRRVMYGASPMPVERLKAAMDLFGPVLQQLYGQTETAPFLTATTLRGTKLEGSEAEVHRLASCGQELLGVSVRVVDDEGRDVAPGEHGEIIAKGPNVMLGYWKRPEETAAALQDGWVRTGDIATVDEENYIFILDRAKDLIITGGENVYSPEVENALYRHPAVLEAAVFGIPHDRWGEEVHAVVVPQSGQEITAEDLIAHCHQWIAPFKCPKTVDFASALPKSGAGKILKSELRKPYWKDQDRAVH